MNTSKIIKDRIIQYLGDGSARVKIGNTEVLVGVKMTVGEPYPDSADEGNLMVSAELRPISSPRFENGPPKFNSIEIGRVTDRVLRESHFIVDPTREEEDAIDARITIGGHDSTINSMQKGESGSLTMEEFYEALDFSEKIHKEVFKKLEKFLK